MLFYTIKRVTALLLIFALIPSRAFSSDFENISGYETGNTPIIDAVSSADYKSLEFFVKLSPKSINDQNIGGATALHIAARNNDIKSTKTLLNVRANLNILDLEGYSPPLRACENKNEKLFALMAKNNKINFNLKNSDGDGFLAISTLAQSYQCLETALNNIIPLRDTSIAKLKKDLKDAFIIALAKNDEKSKTILLKYLDNLHNFEKTMADLDRVEKKANKEVSNSKILKLKTIPKSKKDSKINRNIKNKKQDDFYIIDNMMETLIKKKPAKVKKFILKNGSRGIKIEEVGAGNQGKKVINKKFKRRYKFNNKRLSYKNKRSNYSNLNRGNNNQGLLIKETIIID